jgi:hypothetical protein
MQVLSPYIGHFIVLGGTGQITEAEAVTTQEPRPTPCSRVYIFFLVQTTKGWCDNFYVYRPLIRVVSTSHHIGNSIVPRITHYLRLLIVR